MLYLYMYGIFRRNWTILAAFWRRYCEFVVSARWNPSRTQRHKSQNHSTQPFQTKWHQQFPLPTKTTRFISNLSISRDSSPFRRLIRSSSTSATISIALSVRAYFAPNIFVYSNSAYDDSCNMFAQVPMAVVRAILLMPFVWLWRMTCINCDAVRRAICCRLMEWTVSPSLVSNCT